MTMAGGMSDGGGFRGGRVAGRVLIGWRMLLLSGWLRPADPEGPLQVQSEVLQFSSQALLALRSTRLWCAG